jgi:hypothetical protein
MVSDRDIWCTANRVIQEYGNEAELVASERAEEMLQRSDFDGQRVWRRISRAIREFQAPATGKPN